ICVGPDTIYGDEIQKLRKIIEEDDYLTGSGNIEKIDITKVYQDYIFDNVKVERGCNIAVDGGNGVGGHFALPLFERFNCNVTPIYCDMDGNFPNHFPDPTVEENIADLIALVKGKRLDVGFAYDGDADRIGIVTDKGDVLWGDQLLILFSRFILKDNPGAAIIGEVKCSQNLYDDIEKNGGKGIMWKAGHSLIKSKMKEEKALLAGEMSGHIFFADRYFGFDDAIYASARLLEILSKTGSKLSDMLSDLPKTFTTPEIRVDCPDSMKFQIVDKVKEHFKKGYKTIDIDGVRVQFDNGWGLVRASNTQPVLVLRFESITSEGLDSIRGNVERIVNDFLKDVQSL
ncbi:MAG: phosphomannomutase/phosphoglucomutase, partial [Deltaproteobacteria bacterium]|nr:phosphomannomutase/phosphoglucomutase [Deltaproteobacteria bacterium]